MSRRSLSKCTPPLASRSAFTVLSAVTSLVVTTSVSAQETDIEHFIPYEQLDRIFADTADVLLPREEYPT